MAIRIITGVPGSGKSYFFVNYLYTKQFVNVVPGWKGRFYPRELDPKTLLLHNIDGLQCGHEVQPDIEKIGVDKFFNVPYWEKIYLPNLKKQFPAADRVILALDECQMIFPRKQKISNDVLMFFQWSRHIRLDATQKESGGVDIWLITQDVKNILSEIVVLAEVHYSAAPRSVMPLVNLYAVRISGQKVSTKKLYKNKKVYALYHGIAQGEADRPSSHFALKLLLILLIFVGALWYFRANFGNPEARAAAAELEQQTEKLDPVPIKNSTETAAIPEQLYEWKRIDSVIVYRGGGADVFLPSGLTGQGPLKKQSEINYPVRAERVGRGLVFYGYLPVIQMLDDSKPQPSDKSGLMVNRFSVQPLSQKPPAVPAAAPVACSAPSG